MTAMWRSFVLAVGLAACGGGAQAPLSPSPPPIAAIVREELDRAVAEWTPQAAVAIVLDPATGAILAAEGRDHGKDDPSLPARASWVTGSTLKTFTIAAAIDAGVVTPETRVDAAPRAYGPRTLRDASEHGILSVTDVLLVSSNVGASRVYDAFGLERLLGTLHAFHLSDPPAQLAPIADPHGIDAAMLAGGELMPASPLQVAAAYAAVFAGGVYRAPTTSGQASAPERVLGEATSRTMVAMLERAVSEGSGAAAAVRAMRVAGKTGTGDLGNDRNYASFCGTVLDRAPPRVILVGLYDPARSGNGPKAAAPVFARIARRLYP